MLVRQAHHERVFNFKWFDKLTMSGYLILNGSTGSPCWFDKLTVRGFIYIMFDGLTMCGVILLPATAEPYAGLRLEIVVARMK